MNRPQGGGGGIRGRFVRWAEGPHGGWALFALACLDSFVLPIVPHPLLVALSLAHPPRSMRYATVATVGSVLGGAVGYLIGWKLMVRLGAPVISFYGLESDFARFQGEFQTHVVTVILLGGLSPIPYKLVALSAGAAEVGFWTFTLLSILVRGGKFLTLGWILQRHGHRVRSLLGRPAPWLAVASAGVLLVAAGVFFVGAC